MPNERAALGPSCSQFQESLANRPNGSSSIVAQPGILPDYRPRAPSLLTPNPFPTVSLRAWQCASFIFFAAASKGIRPHQPQLPFDNAPPKRPSGPFASQTNHHAGGFYLCVRMRRASAALTTSRGKFVRSAAQCGSFSATSLAWTCSITIIKAIGTASRSSHYKTKGRDRSSKFENVRSV
jgi:hypothetical protein